MNKRTSERQTSENILAGCRAGRTILFSERLTVSNARCRLHRASGMYEVLVCVSLVLVVIGVVVILLCGVRAAIPKKEPQTTNSSGMRCGGPRVVGHNSSKKEAQISRIKIRPSPSEEYLGPNSERIGIRFRSIHVFFGARIRKTELIPRILRDPSANIRRP